MPVRREDPIRLVDLAEADVLTVGVDVKSKSPRKGAFCGVREARSDEGLDKRGLP